MLKRLVLATGAVSPVALLASNKDLLRRAFDGVNGRGLSEDVSIDSI
jgi:hypothetical protein